MRIAMVNLGVVLSERTSTLLHLSPRLDNKSPASSKQCLESFIELLVSLVMVDLHRSRKQDKGEGEVC